MADPLAPGQPARTPLRMSSWDEIDRTVAVDFHMHTTHTDGTATARQMAEAAVTAVITEILFSEHVRHTSTYFPEFAKEIRALEIPNLQVYVGAEAKILNEDGELDCTTEIAGLSDALIGSVHSPPTSAGGSWSKLSESETVELEFRLALAIVTKSRAHILGHPMGMTITKFRTQPLQQLRLLAAACREHNKAFELNGRYCLSPKEWLAIVTEAGCPVSIGSDAHTTTAVGSAWLTFTGE